MSLTRSIITRLWQKPCLIADDKPRMESWLELFYDVTFVAVVAMLAKRLASDISWLGFAEFVFLYIPIWWAWLGSTMYNNRFETDDVSHRLFTFLKMLPVGGMAITVQNGLEQHAVGFAVSYIAARLILVYLWYRAGSSNPVARSLTDRYVAGFSLSIIFWSASLFVDKPLMFALWGLGMFFDLATPLTTFRIQRYLPKLSTSHLHRRFGLFTIILLGEAVIGILHSISDLPEIHLMTLVIGGFGILLTCSLWWIYFDDVMQEQELPQFPWFALWIYGHFFLALGLTAFGAGIINVVKFRDVAFSWLQADVLLAGAMALSLVSMALIEISYSIRNDRCQLERECGQLRLFGGVITIIVGLSAYTLGPVIMLWTLILSQSFQILRGRSVRRRLGLPARRRAFWQRETVRELN